jgi:AcrR family transcriptional regulator
MAVRSATPGKRPYAPHLPPELRREQLLDAALAITDEHGASGVTVERVARTAGVTRPVVYGQFTDADHVLRALLDRETQRALEQLTPMLPTPSAAQDPVEIAVTAARAYLQAITAEPLRWRAILLPVGESSPLVAERVQQGRALIRSRLEPLFAWALAERGVRLPIDVPVLARLALSLLEESGRIVLTEADEFPPERLVAFVEAFSVQFCAPEPETG